MIKLALFDLGETVLHGTTPFPNAIAGLKAISGWYRKQESRSSWGSSPTFCRPIHWLLKRRSRPGNRISGYP